MRDAIIVLCVLVVTTWLNEVPSVVRHGLEFNSSYTALQTTAQIIAFPLMAVCAIAYAAQVIDLAERIGAVREVLEAVHLREAEPGTLANRLGGAASG